MFLFTKFIALTCLFCLSAALLADLGLFLAARMGGAVGVVYSRWSWVILWGLVWLGSFLLAWHILIGRILARAPK
jgi:hypothetical protein